MKNSICVIGLVLTLLASSGCSSSAVGKRFRTSDESDSEEVIALKARIVELERRAVLAEVEFARLQKQLASLATGDPKTEADVGSGSKAHSSPETGEHQPAPGDSPELDVGGRSGLEVSDLPATGTSVAGGGIESGGTDGDSVSSEGTLTVAAQGLYDRGYTLFHQGHYIDSETAFQQFLRRYSATVLGDNAQFWIGEARFARGDVSGALAAYREAATRFPDGNKVPDAWLKIGDCLRDLGDTEAARESYRTVIRDFPKSAAAMTARESLARAP